MPVRRRRGTPPVLRDFSRTWRGMFREGRDFSGANINRDDQPIYHSIN